MIPTNLNKIIIVFNRLTLHGLQIKQTLLVQLNVYNYVNKVNLVLNQTHLNLSEIHLE